MGIEDVSVFDLRLDRPAVAESEFAVTAVDSAQSGLLARPAAVLVCTPPSGHITVARQAIDAVAHVFNEKPMSHTRGGVPELVDAAARSGLILMLCYNLRFHAPLRKVHELVQSGAIGRVMVVRAEFGQYLRTGAPLKITGKAI